MPIRHWYLTALVLPAIMAGASDRELLRDELRDAVSREQQELRSRAEALAEQAETAATLLQKQQAYIEQLEAEIRALQKASESDD
jgi:septal ring factor EnvC (AmiA/AmiB activator)